MKIKSLTLAIAASTVFASSAYAGMPENLSINGFGTIGVSHMSGEDRTFGIRDNIDDGFSFKEDSKIGVQARYAATDKLSFTGQAKVQSYNEDYKVKLNWLYGAYDVSNRLTVRAGRLVSPVFLKSDTIDVGYSYPWIRTPSELHSLVTTQSYNGINGLYNFSVAGQQVDLEGYYGMTTEEDFSYLGNPATIESDEIYGLSATLPLRYGFVRAYHGSATGMDVEVDDLPDGLNSFEDLKGSFTSLGGQFNYDKLTVLGEIARLGGGDLSEKDAFYVTTGYQVTPTLQPHVTYSRLDDDETGGNQTTVTAGVRYDVYPGVAVKAEYSKVKADGYQGLYDASGLSGLMAASANPDSLSAESDIASLAVDFVF